jgi:hypothetical protein
LLIMSEFVQSLANCLVRSLGIVSLALPVFALADASVGEVRAQGATETTVVTPARSSRATLTSRTWAPYVAASYKVAFNGFDVGKFDFESSIKGSSYSLQGQAHLSALLGVFQWTGMTRTSGTLSGDRPRPAGYAFEFSGSGRSGFVKMGFSGSSVSSFSSFPLLPAPPGNIPIKDAHLKDVFDPLSAVMALSRGNLDNPCGRRLAIFDGKQRFDLVLSYKGTERLTEAKSSGQPDVVHVCRVRYIPIAGYAPNDEVKAMTQAAIEISLRPVPSANLLVPHQIVIPTAAGTATLTSERISITTPARAYIALVN